MWRPFGWTLGGAFLVAVGCYAGGPLDSTGPGDSSSVSTTPTRRLRRLSSREYDNVVRDLLGDATQPAQAFLIDSYANGYDNGSAGLAVQSDQVVSYQAAAEALAANAVKSGMVRILGGCNVAQSGDAACVEAFLATTAARAFRRPLTSTEAARLRAMYAADAQTSGGFARGVQTMLEVVLQSPQFLYREELGPFDAVASPGASLRLTDYEMASELSFMLTGSIPDDALWADVQNGRFDTASDFQRVATRLLATPAAKDALRSFLHEWLATDRLSTLTKDPTFYPTFKPAMAASMHGELDAFYGDVLFSGNGSLRQLFTSSQGFADQTLGALYGVPGGGAAFQPVALDPTLRAGVMTRAGFLAVHSDTDSSGPIARGVFLLQRIFCTPPAPPPANVPPAPPAGAPSTMNETTRQRFAQHASSAFCAGCHKQIDGVGFGFEEFDGIGAFRSTENGLPVDSSGTIVGTGEIDGDYTGVTQLTGKLAGSHLLADCFRQQAYRYAMGQIEPVGSDLGSIGPAFSTDAQLTDILLAIVASPIFQNRTFESVGP
jgi:hypothetical protein